MPISKSLSKIQKNIKGDGKKHTIHPKGRKFHQLTRATLREDKIAAKKRAHNEKRSNELARVKFVQDVTNSEAFKDKKVFDFDEIVIFLKQFIARDDEELEELKQKRRSNRPPSNRQLILQQKRDLEEKELRSGFLVPDLTDAENVTFLRNWNQTFGSLSTLKLIRVNDNGQKVVGGSKSTASKVDVNMN
ncbi:LAFE_0G08196g1_1 [Lachancea fermentati]|uniref:LAFE_0G08196g1_1 n=1 Tax=Lachancea fermentati TaxID=4955 RepID=A0A1G4MHR9_LACFM|nr:LAFE_0G08196g1_1 [Lachancea fermentati]